MKVLISVDESKIAANAFDWYFEHIHQDGNEVIICHICEQPAIPVCIFLDDDVVVTYSDDIEKLRQEATQKLNSLKKAYETRMEGKNVTAKFLFNFADIPVGEAIIQIANKEQCDAIITGSRGMGAFRRTILGSVSDYVMHHAKATVMVCHS
uniref:UspA domain-containing protein n=1 Tax=Ciona savignyi TaxID=51511 RepID=H2YBS5_CIOSA